MSEAEPSPDPKPAPRLGSYLLIKQLGSGGMSNVFRAVHEDSGSVVAVKVLPRTLARNLTLLQRFLREAKSAEALDHPNIVAIYDRGFDQGRHYLVLEFVEGRDLHDRVRINGPLDPKEAVRFVREVAEGLRYAASRGMIHRDVKPANLLMTPDGHAKIIDLGLALQTDDEDERVTRDGTTVGTVDYMAPEQARDSRQTSERSDIYSLGCTFYYLLTGSQPYPGGGLADKLARHYKAPIPDPRVVRPDVTERLSLLIRRMMEKKPDQRYADYTELIAALDALGEPSAPGPAAPVTLDALIVEDDEDDDGLAPTESAVTRVRGHGGRPPSTRDYLTAEVVDEDDDEEPSPEPRKSRELPGRREPSPPAEVSLAELAALDSDEEASTRRQGKRPATSTSITPRAPSPPSVEAMLEDDEPVEGASIGVRKGGGAELPIQTWIAAGLMVGLAIAIVGFGVSALISLMKPKVEEVAVRPRTDAQPEEEAPVPTPTPRTVRPGPVRPSVARPTPLPPVKPAAQTPDGESKAVAAATAPPPEEFAYPKELEDRLGPPTSPTEPASPTAGRIAVRRVLEPGDEPQTASLAAAFNRNGDLVEIADTGPFFEDDCQVAGRSRTIRARPGIRPMIMIEPATLQLVKEQEAKFVLGGPRLESLVLEGIDLAVDLRNLPDQQSALFLCRGAEVTLRNCSITLVNASDRRVNRFALFRFEDGTRPNRLLLDRSTIRGPIRTLVDVAATQAEVVLDRSMVVGDSGPLVAIEPSERGVRSLTFHRSVVASRGPVVEVAGRSAPVAVRSLGSTFARIDGANASGLFHAKAASTAAPKAVLEWSGEDNAFVGWPSWLTMGTESQVRIAGLDGVRANWPDSDATSRESSGPWPPTLARDGVGPRDLDSLIPERRGTLAKVAEPHPHLRELTYDAIARLTAPELSATLIPPAQPFVAPAVGFEPLPGPAAPTAKGPVTKAAPVPPAAVKPPGPLDLSFDVLAAPWSGDLGKFLAEKLVPGTPRATIRVRGTGTFASSPIRFADGLSIAILGDSPEQTRLAMPTFIPRPEAAGRSLFELRRGDLAIENLAFTAEGGTRPGHWVRVEDGLLGLRHCRFRDPGAAAEEVGAVVAIVAAGSDPIPPRAGPFASPTDRPTARLEDCLIWTGDDALSAEVGRGVVALENCLIISGGPAFSLLPGKVGRDRFEADLILDRCTISVDHSGIVLGPWPGDPTGPDRPWLVSTRASVFPRTQVGGAGALLQVDPQSMMRGVVFWQSYSDIYEVARFVGSTGPPPASVTAADIKKGWIDLWGSRHARNVRGPSPSGSSSILRYKDKERPKPGKVTPGSLELDPKLMRDLGADFKALPPAPRG